MFFGTHCTMYNKTEVDRRRGLVLNSSVLCVFIKRGMKVRGRGMLQDEYICKILTINCKHTFSMKILGDTKIVKGFRRLWKIVEYCSILWKVVEGCERL